MSNVLRGRPQDLWRDYLSSDLGSTLLAHARTPPDGAVLALFRDVAARVPAYRAFLAERRVDPAGVRSLDDFRRLPLVTKDDYVRRYPLAERCRGGRIDGCEMLAFSSGSTGEATIWPRALEDELAAAARFEQVFRAFDAGARRTLAVVCFPLGTWVGGMYTTACCRLLAAKGYPVTVVSPGNNVAEILRAVPPLAPSFEQVVLLGYPPFLKGLVDEGIARGVPWRDYDLKLVLAGEVVTEEWRTLVASRAGIHRPLHGIASLYGTADAGVLGNETPLSVAIRRALGHRPDVARAIFGEARLPTLVQYDPHVRFFEAHEGTLVFTCDGPAPLVRYHISDTGGVLPYEDLVAALGRHGIDPFEELGRDEPSVVPLPFVYVFGRSHHAVSHYGANVFPEMVSAALEQPGLAEHVTGKFVMSVREDEDRDTHLCFVVELARGAPAEGDLGASLADAIARSLTRLSSEYAAYVPRERQTPRVELRPPGDPEYFPVGVKHVWTRKASSR